MAVSGLSASGVDWALPPPACRSPSGRLGVATFPGLGHACLLDGIVDGVDGHHGPLGREADQFCTAGPERKALQAEDSPEHPWISLYQALDVVGDLLPVGGRFGVGIELAAAHPHTDP